MIQWQASQYFWKRKQNTVDKGEGVSMGIVSPIEQLAVIPVIFRGEQSFGQTVQTPSTYAFPIPFQTTQDTVLVDGPVFHPQWRPESRPVTTAKSNKWNHETIQDRAQLSEHRMRQAFGCKICTSQEVVAEPGFSLCFTKQLLSFEIHLPLTEEDRCVGG